MFPVRDARETLDEALRCLLAQRDVDFEIVAVDDGSMDGSAEFLEAHAARDARLRVFRAPARGIVAALRDACGRARGSVFARMDADDTCPPDRLAKQLALLNARPDLGLVSCLVGPVQGARFAGGYAHYVAWLNRLTEPEAIARNVWAECPLAHPTWMMRREVYEQAGGYRETGWPEDYDLMLRMHARGVRMAKVPEVLLRWRDTPTRLSRTDPRYSDDAFARCTAHHLARGPFANRREVAVIGAGRTTRKRAEHLTSEGLSIAAYVDVDPRKIGHRVHGRAVLAWDEIPSPVPWPLLAYVGSRGAREEIRAHAAERGFREGLDFFVCW
ncbi:MAG: glycosyltransferase [Deltaproteobacteria bacterium]|nr:glycosyltransferase [Deltaproteobacteria bacterium]